MYLCLTGLHFLFVAAQCNPEVFLANNADSAGGSGFPVDRSYVFYSSPTKEPVIQRVQFTRQQGGRVFITAKQGRLPRGQYDCGYRLQQSSGAPRITLTLMDQCAQLVKDSSGYFNNAFLTGSYIENGYQYLYVQTATTGYDVYPLQIGSLQ
ncbi:hypothetical protein FOZ60_014876 [Perkinsus olseni]|uniref:Uncharacterized protein n=1 Tax=Perkinsus olseni TaxID=32597 RepID=A0A7J6N744_PEROL|nr:hypothetical protein FOZ60_014876 [Perkinsus olseni]